MTFDEALKKLNIEDHREKIINSNSHGEIFYLQDYIIFAEIWDKSCIKTPFRKFFLDAVEWANETWERPESIYQHIKRVFVESYQAQIEEMKRKELGL